MDVPHYVIFTAVFLPSPHISVLRNPKSTPAPSDHYKKSPIHIHQQTRDKTRRYNTLKQFATGSSLLQSALNLRSFIYSILVTKYLNFRPPPLLFWWSWVQIPGRRLTTPTDFSCRFSVASQKRRDGVSNYATTTSIHVLCQSVIHKRSCCWTP